MSLLTYYQYLCKGKIRPVDIDTVKKLTNPSAICTVQQHMVINTFNKTFTLEEVKEIVEFVTLKIEKEKLESFKILDEIAQKLFKISYRECDTDEKLEVKKLVKTYNHK